MPVPAAVDATAAGLRVAISGACVTLTLGEAGVSGEDGGRSARPALATALADTLRALTGDVRVVVIRSGNWAAPPAPPVAPAAPVPSTSPTPPAPPAPPGPSASPPATADASAPPGGPAGGDPDPWSQALGRLSARPDLISVAVVEGPAVGAGLALALACDLRVLSEDATLRCAEAAAGLVPATGVAGTLVDLVGYPRALHLCLTGRPVDAAEAQRLGLATLVAPRAAIGEEVDRLVASLLAVPREAGAETKALLAAARGRSAAQRREAEGEAVARLLAAVTGNVG